MCKFNPKGGGRKLDPCMKKLIHFLSNIMPPHLKLRACCCGHNKYPMTIVYENISQEDMFKEMVSQTRIPRKKRFYKKDKQGYYFIPEVIEHGK